MFTCLRSKYVSLFRVAGDCFGFQITHVKYFQAAESIIFILDLCFTKFYFVLIFNSFVTIILNSATGRYLYYYWESNQLSEFLRKEPWKVLALALFICFKIYNLFIFMSSSEIICRAYKQLISYAQLFIKHDFSSVFGHSTSWCDSWDHLLRNTF